MLAYHYWRKVCTGDDFGTYLYQARRPPPFATSQKNDVADEIKEKSGYRSYTPLFDGVVRSCPEPVTPIRPNFNLQRGLPNFEK